MRPAIAGFAVAAVLLVCYAWLATRPEPAATPGPPAAEREPEPEVARRATPEALRPLAAPEPAPEAPPPASPPPALDGMGDEALAAIARSDPSAERRSAAIDRLALSRSPALLDPAIVALGDREAGVRAAAARALGILGDERAASALQRALDVEPDASVRSALTRALGLVEARGVRGFDPERRYPER